MSSPNTKPAAVATLVEDHIQSWLTTQNRQRENARIEPAKPMITVSREYGTGGGLLSQQIAARIGFHYWNQDILQEIATSSDMSESIMRTLDQHSRNEIEDIIAGIFLGKTGTQHEYVKQVQRVVRSISEFGSGIIIGRGGQFILGSEEALKVRFVGRPHVRVQWVIKHEDLSESAAKIKVQERDQERDYFHHRYYNVDQRDPVHYDLVVNTSDLPSEAAADLVIDAYYRKFGIKLKNSE